MIVWTLWRDTIKDPYPYLCGIFATQERAEVEQKRLATLFEVDVQEFFVCSDEVKQ